MISTEIFIMMQLFLPQEVNWWWILLFLFFDAMSFGGVKQLMKEK